MSIKRPMNSKNSKNTRKAITLTDKCEVLRRIDAGERIVDISKALEFAKSTIQSIRENKDKIKKLLQVITSPCKTKLVRQRSNLLEQMENLLNLWIEDNNQRRIPMSL